MDYLFVRDKVLSMPQPGDIILDVGAGPGGIHGFLEARLGRDIIGIDTRRWDSDYIDAVGNFLDDSFLSSLGINPGSVDLIISTSAFEHQSLKQHRRCIQQCRRYLRPTGTALITTTMSVGRTRFNFNPRQWDASRQKLQKIYELSWSAGSTEEIAEAYRNSHELQAAYSERFGSLSPRYPTYLSVGAQFGIA